MGKLIKNHWARLIVLTAAICEFTLLAVAVLRLTYTCRSSCRCDRGVFLAQNLLGLPHQKSRYGCQTIPCFADNQLDPRPNWLGLGMAAEIHRRIEPPQIDRSAA